MFPVACEPSSLSFMYKLNPATNRSKGSTRSRMRVVEKNGTLFLTQNSWIHSNLQQLLQKKREEELFGIGRFFMCQH